MLKMQKFKFRFFQYFLFLTIGFILGIGAIWPGLFTERGRKCFIKIIKDGSDGNVSLVTIFSISPNYLLKIKNEENRYYKILLIGDNCFRKF